MEKKKPYFTTYRLVFIAVMAAIVYVLTLLRFPLLGSKVHFANAACLLSGLLFGPVAGGLAAGIGSALNDALAGGYDFIQCLITLVSKFAMAAVCALIAGTPAKREAPNHLRVILGSVIGALSYVALYMLKTYVYQRFVYGNPLEATGLAMAGKLPASMINAVVAMIVAPLLYWAVLPPLRRAGLTEKL